MPPERQDLYPREVEPRSRHVRGNLRPVLEEALDAADALYRYNGGAVTH
jgi:hypothetical protein